MKRRDFVQLSIALPAISGITIAASKEAVEETISRPSKWVANLKCIKGPLRGIKGRVDILWFDRSKAAPKSIQADATLYVDLKPHNKAIKLTGKPLRWQLEATDIIYEFDGYLTDVEWSDLPKYLYVTIQGSGAVLEKHI